GQRRSTRYCLVEKEIIPASGEPYDGLLATPAPSLIKESINSAISYVKKPIFERIPASYDFDWFDAYQPNETFYLTEAQRTQLQQAGHRNQPPEPAGTYARKIYNRLLIDLSYNSSRLEGNTYSLIETQKLLSEGVSVEGKLDAETVMILNHKEAIRYLVDHSTHLKPGFTEVCTLHYLLSDGLVLNQYAGKVRDQAVRIGGSVFIPLEGQPILEAQLNKVCEKACQIINPYEQSLFLLIHIAYLQAFIDVNKRTSRLSANIPLISQNLVPLSFNDVVNDDYSSAIIALYELKSIEPIAELFCFSYLRTCQQYDATVESMGFDLIRIRYRQQRRELVRQIVVNKVVGDSINDNIRVYSQSNIVAADQDAFEASVMDELKEIAPPRIVGMGFSATDLQAWLMLSPLA
ncbi:MAG: Fic family protein, partial [Phenylobacterium sp.]